MIEYSGPATTKTTTGNIDDLDFGNATILRMNNATDATIRGLVAGVDGQRVTIVSIGAGHVFLAHQNTNSTAVNRLINSLTAINTPLAAGVGYATLQYDATTTRWRLVDHNQGKPITVAYASGNFTSPTGTWVVDSGDQVTYSYFFVGKVCEVTIFLTTTTVTGTPANLQITLPFTPLADVFAVSRSVDNGVGVAGLIRAVSGGDTHLYCYRDAAAANWAAATNNSGVQGSIRFEV